MTTRKKAVAKTPEQRARKVMAPALGDPVYEGDQGEFSLGTEIAVLFPLVEMQPPSWHLPPFSGKKVRCAKCGLGAGESDASVAASYHSNATTYSACYNTLRTNMPLYQQIGFPEHLDRRCTVCGHQWVEAIAPDPQDL